jgi:hypothetical protein
VRAFVRACQDVVAVTNVDVDDNNEDENNGSDGNGMDSDRDNCDGLLLLLSSSSSLLLLLLLLVVVVVVGVVGGDDDNARYVPYGPVHEVMPYLIRRVQENSSLISDTKSQRQMLMQELRRRLRKAVAF